MLFKYKKAATLLIVTAVFTSLIFLTHFEAQSWNDASRFATIEQVVENKTFVIDQSSFFTGDAVFIDGHFYSDKPPVFSVFSSVPYFFLYKIGFIVKACSQIMIYLTTVFSVLSFTVIFFIFFYFLSRGYFLLTQSNGEVRGSLNGNHLMILLALFITGTAIFPYSTVLNNHLPAGVLCAIAVALSRVAYKPPERKNLFLVGFLFGLACVIDLSALFFTFIFFLYFVFVEFASEKDNGDSGLLIDRIFKIVYFLVGCSLPILSHWALNLYITGDIIPASLQKEFFLYEGSAFNSGNLTGASFAIGSAREWFNYFFEVTFGSRGFFIHNPALLLGFCALPFLISFEKKLIDKLFFFACALSIFCVVMYYSLLGKSGGGSAYTVRWFVVFAPMLFIPLARLVQIFRKKMYPVIIFILLLSSIWNVPASAFVFKNLSKYPSYNGINAVKKFPNYLRAQSDQWENIFVRKKYCEEKEEYDIIKSNSN
ncbi:MAG: hypothetical protein ABH832_02700 [bacterium]